MQPLRLGCSVSPIAIRPMAILYTLLLEGVAEAEG